MFQVWPGRLWIGHAGDGQNITAIMENRIEAVVQLAREEPLESAPRELVICRFPLVDGTGNSPALLRLAVGTVAAILAVEKPILVTCGAGMSRAPAVVAAAIAWNDRAEPRAILEQIARNHPCDVSPVLWRELLLILPGD